MAEIFVCTFLGLLLISLGCLAVKYPLLIGGYNTLSKFERSKIDIRPYALFMRKVTGIMGGSLIASFANIEKTTIRDLWRTLCKHLSPSSQNREAKA